MVMARCGAVVMLPLIFAGVSALAGATGAYLWQENHYERVIAEQRAVQSALLAEAHANARRATERLQKAKDEAEKRAAKRLADARADAARASAALGMLGDAADTALRTANDSHSSCQRVVTTYADIQQQCSSRLVEVGTAADRASSEAVTLREAWPSAKP